MKLKEFNSEHIQMSLDNIDIEILRLLQKDSSMPFIDIAKKIGVTDGTVHHRVKKLKKSGVIKSFTILFDHSTMGMNSLAYILIVVNPGNMESVLNEIKKLTNVLEIQEVHAAQGDLLIKIRAHSQEEIRDIVVTKIRKIEGIAETDMLPVFKSWKEEINPPIDGV
jgi:Lrp/AsnC family transcriptional regulator for asnA, asnC and gidA